MTVAQASSVFLLLYPTIGLFVAGAICLTAYDFSDLGWRAILILILAWPVVVVMVAAAFITEFFNGKPRP